MNSSAEALVLTGPNMLEHRRFDLPDVTADTARLRIEACGLCGTDHEQYSYMSMWSLMAAPLIFSGDMAKLDAFTLNVLCNPEVIEVDQDPLGRQGEPVVREETALVLAKPMEDGSLAVGLFNLAEDERTVAATWEQLGLSGTQRARDLWRQKDLGIVEGRLEATVPRHGGGRPYPPCVPR